VCAPAERAVQTPASRGLPELPASCCWRCFMRRIRTLFRCISLKLRAGGVRGHRCVTSRRSVVFEEHACGLFDPNRFTAIALHSPPVVLREVHPLIEHLLKPKPEIPSLPPLVQRWLTRAHR